MKTNINRLLTKVEQITRSRHHDQIVLEYADGTRTAMTAGEAIDQCQTRSDIVRATGGPGQGLLPQLITAMFEGEDGTQ